LAKVIEKHQEIFLNGLKNNFQENNQNCKIYFNWIKNYDFRQIRRGFNQDALKSAGKICQRIDFAISSIIK
jgi:hypothetical protein